MIRNLLSVLALCLAAPQAIAGMACPTVNIYNVGSPDWLSNRDILDALPTQQSWIGINATDHAEGRRVTRIAPKAPAARAGLLEGDILMSVNGTDDLTFDNVSIGETLALIVRRQGQDLPITLTVGRADPVHFAMAVSLEPDLNRCPNATMSQANYVLRNIILKNVLTDDRVFRCDDAHEALAFMGEDYQINEAYMVRGSRRILLTVPRFGTACIASDALSGAKLTPENARAFLLAAVEPLFAYQEANP